MHKCGSSALLMNWSCRAADDARDLEPITNLNKVICLRVEIINASWYRSRCSPPCWPARLWLLQTVTRWLQAFTQDPRVIYVINSTCACARSVAGATYEPRSGLRKSIAWLLEASLATII